MPSAVTSPVDALPPGAVISNRYKLLKALGQGGFGITYIAWDAKLARNVAVKECFPVSLCRRDPMSGAVLPLSPAAEPAYLAALDDMRKEAQTLAQVEHARVLRVHDVIWGNGSVFLITPWLSGGSLAERMADAAHLPAEAEHLAWLADVVEGLAYLHGKGIIHRDIKPANILFGDDGRPVIIDLGAALNRNPADLTRSATTRGAFSPGYASPEQACGKGKIGPWTDFYSLAATWYELLTGTRPEDAEKRLMEDDLVPLPAAALRISCPREVRALLQRNLALRPGQRCRDAADWQRVLQGGSLPPLRSRRRDFLYAEAAAAVLSAMGIAGYAALRPLPPAAQPGRAAAADIAAVRAELNRKMEAYFGVEAFIARSREAEQTAEREQQAWMAARDTRLAEIRRSISTLESPESLKKLAREVDDLAHRRTLAAKQEALQKEYDEYVASHPYRDLASQYPTQNLTELTLLPTVAQELEQKLRAAHNDASVAIVMMVMNTANTNEETKLGLDIAKRVNELKSSSREPGRHR